MKRLSLAEVSISILGIFARDSMGTIMDDMSFSVDQNQQLLSRKELGCCSKEQPSY